MFFFCFDNFSLKIGFSFKIEYCFFDILSPSQTMNQWIIAFPSDPPYQKDGHNCDPYTNMSIFSWVMHRRPSTTYEWDPSIPDPATASRQVEASFHRLSSLNPRRPGALPKANTPPPPPPPQSSLSLSNNGNLIVT